jgi:PIN domain nuclease of toxin-antitoxin system
VRLLLDTHIAYWLSLHPERLTAGELRLLSESTDSLAYSAVSIWELRLKWNSFHPSGARKGPVSPDTVLSTLRLAEFEELSLTAGDAAAELSVAMPHKDPFDELLLVQAQQNDRRLLTRDANLAGHPLAVSG